MPRAWHETNPTLLFGVQEAVQTAYPSLHFTTMNGVVFMRGSFPLTDGTTVLDRYSIEVEFATDHPQGVPKVREVGGRIPRTVDRHIVDASGLACLFVPDERAWLYPVNATVLDFLNGPVRSFFLSQSLFELEGRWPFGQRSHGIQGILEFYAEVLETQDVKLILEYLDLLKHREIRGHWRCPCGSGRRLRDCHLLKIVNLHAKIPPSRAGWSWLLIRRTLFH
jgi:hypothetical protein